LISILKVRKQRRQQQKYKKTLKFELWQGKKVIKNKLNELISNGNILKFWGSDFDMASITRTSFKDGYNFESKSNK
jgi:hypothetical protein